MSDRRSRDDDDRGGRRGGGRGGSGYEYKRRDPDETRKRAETGGGSIDTYITDGIRIFKSAEGPNEVRIMPPTWEGAKHYGIDVHLHYGIGADNAAYLCLDKMKGKACPICEERKRAADEDDQEYADELRPQHRVLMYVIDRDKEKEGVKVWSMSSRQDQDILRLCVDKKTGETLEIDHPEDGYDLSFDRQGQGKKTRYSAWSIARRSSPLDNDKAMQFAVENPLDEQLVFYSYDHIKGAFAGRSSGAGRGRDRDEDDKDKDRGGRSRGRDDDDKDKDKGRDNERGGRDRDDGKERTEQRRSTRRPELDMTWDEVHELTFRKLVAIVEEQRLDIDPDSSRDDEELADQICEACDITKPKARSSRDDDPPMRTRPTSRDDDKDKDRDGDRRGRDRDDDRTERRPLRGGRD